MITMTLAVTDDLIAKVIAIVESQHPPATSPQSDPLKIQASADLLAAADEDAWHRLTDLFQKCAHKGKAIIQAEVSSFLEYVEERSIRLGKDAKAFRERLLKKIREMIATTFDVMLAAMRSEIIVGESKLMLKTLNLEQKLVFSSSLQVSLTSLCEFAGGGELTVTGTYSLE